MPINIIKLDKIPFFLGLLFSLLGWCIKHVVDRTIDTPIIEYKIFNKVIDGEYFMYYRIKNISSTKKYSNINFFLTSTDTSNVSIKGFDLALYPPLIENQKNVRTEGFPSYVSFNISEFQPKSHFGFHLKVSSLKDIPLRIQSNDAIILTKPTFKTFILENEIIILIIFSIALSFLIYIYLNSKELL